MMASALTLLVLTVLIVAIAFATFVRLRDESARDAVDVWLSMLAKDIYNDTSSVAHASVDVVEAWLLDNAQSFAVERKVKAFGFVHERYIVERLLDFIAIEHDTRRTVCMNHSTLARLLQGRTTRND